MIIGIYTEAPQAVALCSSGCQGFAWTYLFALFCSLFIGFKCIQTPHCNIIVRSTRHHRSRAAAADSVPIQGSLQPPFCLFDLGTKRSILPVPQQILQRQAGPSAHTISHANGRGAAPLTKGVA